MSQRLGHIVTNLFILIVQRQDERGNSLLRRRTIAAQRACGDGTNAAIAVGKRCAQRQNRLSLPSAKAVEPGCRATANAWIAIFQVGNQSGKRLRQEEWRKEKQEVKI